MVIIYASNTGNTEKYAKILQEDLNLPAYPIDNIPDVHKGGEVIYLGWIMGGTIVGYKKISKMCDVKCVIGVGMSPESPEMAESFRQKIGAGPETAVFYVQGGYDMKKLKGVNKMIMKVVEPKILKNFEGMSEEEKQENPTYKMLKGGYSVVSEERLGDVLAWAVEKGLKGEKLH
ncbi:MAG: hypothetical protein E7240_09610 [Lachnospiraceae bacterium]|nr:hypothetical protein [Lachnospiraceae bacterium]